MGPQLPLLRGLLMLLTLLGLLLDPTVASLPSNSIDSTPQPIDPNDGGGGGGGGGSPGSTDIIGGQPATVQLGSGFIVGCVIGVILYTVVRLSMRVVKSTLADTQRTRGEGDTAGEGVLVEV